MSSTLGPSPAEKEEEHQEKTASVVEKQEGGNSVVSSYWGIFRPKLTREDGTEWPWNCFMVVLYN